MTQPLTPQPAADTKPAAPRPRRRWARRLRHVVLISLGLLVAAWLLVTQTGVLRAVVLPRLSQMLGCDADCGRVTVGLTGRVVVRGLELSARDLQGDAARFLEAPSLAVSLDWPRLLAGEVRLTRIELRRPRIRISQGPELTLNVGSLRRSATGATVPTRIPTVEVSDGILELGEHTVEHVYTELTRVHVRGWVRPTPGNPDLFTINLSELEPGSARRHRAEKPGGMQLTGSSDLAHGRAELQLTNLDLAQWSRRTAPSVVRDLWRTMAVTGSVSKATLNYTRGEGVAATFDLKQVDMNIPLRVEGDAARLAMQPGEIGPGEERLLAMRDVSGAIAVSPQGLRADLDGVIGDLRCGVILTTQGLSVDSAMHCRIGASGFKIADKPDLLPLAPYVVKKLFRRFSSPTAEVDGWVEIVRAEPTPDGPSPIRVSGALDLRNGRAEYEKFPYPVNNIEGHVQFDGQRVRIVRITGDGPTGAKVVATGVVEPPTTNAAVAIDVKVTDIDLDDTFRDAMPPGRRGVFTTLFNNDAYDQLVRAGLVRPSGEDADLRAQRDNVAQRLDRAQQDADAAAQSTLTAELARLERALTVPVFDLGGPASLDIRVRREYGEHTDYVTRIDLAAPKAGVVVPNFPYPAWARDIAIRIGDERADIDRMELAGLSGAAGALRGHVTYGSASSGDFEPFITIDVPQLPVDPLLLNALPGEGTTHEPEDELGARAQLAGFSARRLLREMGLAGNVSGHAEIFPREDDPSRTGFKVAVDIDGISAQPGHGRVRADDLTGKLVITHHELTLDSLTGRVGDAPLTGAAHARFAAEGDATALTARLTVSGMDLATPVEDIVQPMAPERADTVRRARERFNPTGRLDASVLLDTSDTGLSFRGVLSELRGVQFDVLGERATLRDPRGAIAFTPSAVEFEDFQSAIDFGEEPSGNVSLTGALAGSPDQPATLDMDIRGGRWDSALVRAIADHLDPAVTAWMREVELAGDFDAVARHATSRDAPPSTTGAISPRTLSLIRRGTPIEFQTVNGTLAFDRAGGRIEHLSAQAPAWSFTADGTWATGDAARLDVTLGVQSQGLPPDLRAALPADVDEALEAADIAVDGALSLPGGRLSVWRGTGDGLGASFSGTLAFGGLRADPGVAITQASGQAAIDARGEPAQRPDVQLVVTADSFRAGGVVMTDGRLRLQTSEQPGTVTMPEIAALVHGGALTGRGVIETSPTRAEPDRRSYELHADLSGVRFGDLLDNLMQRPQDASAEPAGERQPGPWRGVMDGSVSAAGIVGDVAARTGRGLVRVQGSDDRPAEVMRLPGVMPVLRLSNLQLPVRERLDFAFAEFHFDGPRIAFDTLSVRSRSIAIEGSGAMRLPGMELALRFNTRSLNRVVFLSDLFEGMRDELVTTVVTGTAYDPVFGYEQLSQTREFIDTALGETDRATRRNRKNATP